MSSLRALWIFDFSRCRWFLVSFWLYCLLQALVGFYCMWSCDLFGLQEDTPVAFAYLLIAVYMQKCQPAKRWSSPVEERWSDWMLYSPESGRRGRQMGGGGGHTTTLTGFQLEKSRIRFKSGNGYPQGFQEFSELEALEIIHLQSHYLGSTEVNVVVEDFALVTEKSIKWTQR